MEKSEEQIKAEELLNGYKCYLHELGGSSDIYWIDINKTKNDAIRAVNLVLDEHPIVIDHMDIFALNERRKYWKEVRSCIAESQIFELENEELKKQYREN